MGIVNRLTLVIASLTGGGAERVLTRMGNYWARRGRQVTLITLSGAEGDCYRLCPEARRIALNVLRPSANALEAAWQNLWRLWRLRTAIRCSKPEAVISFLDKTNILTLLATRGLPVPTIVSERIDPTQRDIGPAWSALRGWCYPGAAAVVVQTEAVRAWAQPFVPVENIRVIPNPIALPPVAPRPRRSEREGRVLLGMGRLTAQKGFDLLLKAFAQVASRYPEWTLRILGEGEARRDLEALARQLGISERVALPGYMQETIPELRQADLFVLPSRYEGFPNALCEAMAVGLPVIAADCRSGPRDIIRQNVDGLLVPVESVSALAGALDRLMGDPAERRRLADCAPQVCQRFGEEQVMNQWEELLQTVRRRG